MCIHLALCGRRNKGEQLEQVLDHHAVGGREQEHQQLQALSGGSCG